MNEKKIISIFLIVIILASTLLSFYADPGNTAVTYNTTVGGSGGPYYSNDIAMRFYFDGAGVQTDIQAFNIKNTHVYETNYTDYYPRDCRSLIIAPAGQDHDIKTLGQADGSYNSLSVSTSTEHLLVQASDHINADASPKFDWMAMDTLCSYVQKIKNNQSIGKNFNGNYRAGAEAIDGVSWAKIDKIKEALKKVEKPCVWTDYGNRKQVYNFDLSNFETEGITFINKKQSFSLTPEEATTIKFYPEIKRVTKPHYDFQTNMLILLYAAAYNEARSTEVYNLEDIARTMFDASYTGILGARSDYSLCYENVIAVSSPTGKDYRWYTIESAVQSLGVAFPYDIFKDGWTSEVMQEWFKNNTSYIDFNYKGQGFLAKTKEGKLATLFNYYFSGFQYSPPPFKTTWNERLKHPFMETDKDEWIEGVLVDAQSDEKQTLDETKYGFGVIAMCTAASGRLGLDFDSTGAHQIKSTPTKINAPAGSQVQAAQIWSAPIEENYTDSPSGENIPAVNKLTQDIGKFSTANGNAYMDKIYVADNIIYDSKEDIYYSEGNLTSIGSWLETNKFTGIWLDKITFEFSAEIPNGVFSQYSKIKANDVDVMVSLSGNTITFQFPETEVMLPHFTNLEKVKELWANYLSSEIQFGYTAGTFYNAGNYNWNYDSSDCKAYFKSRCLAENITGERNDIYWIKGFQASGNYKEFFHDSNDGSLIINGSNTNKVYETLFEEGAFSDINISADGTELTYDLGNSQATTAITLKPIEVTQYSWENEPEAYAEIKAFDDSLSNSNRAVSTLNRSSETYNVMSGIPTTKDVYIEVGGTPLRLSLQAQRFEKHYTRTYHQTVGIDNHDKENTFTSKDISADAQYTVSWFRPAYAAFRSVADGDVQIYHPELFDQSYCDPITDDSVAAAITLDGGFTITAAVTATSYNIENGLYHFFNDGKQTDSLGTAVGKEQDENPEPSSTGWTINRYLPDNFEYWYDDEGEYKYTGLTYSTISQAEADLYNKLKSQNLTVISDTLKIDIVIKDTYSGEVVWTGSMEILDSPTGDTGTTANLYDIAKVPKIYDTAADGTEKIYHEGHEGQPDILNVASQDCWKGAEYDTKSYIPIIGYNGNPKSEQRREPNGNTAPLFIVDTTGNYEPDRQPQFKINQNAQNGLYHFENMKEYQLLRYGEQRNILTTVNQDNDNSITINSMERIDLPVISKSVELQYTKSDFQYTKEELSNMGIIKNENIYNTSTKGENDITIGGMTTVPETSENTKFEDTGITQEKIDTALALSTVYINNQNGDTEKTPFFSINPILIHNPVTTNGVQLIDISKLTDQRVETKSHTEPRCYLDYSYELYYPNDAPMYDPYSFTKPTTLFSATNIKGPGYIGTNVHYEADQNFKFNDSSTGNLIDMKVTSPRSDVKSNVRADILENYSADSIYGGIAPSHLDIHHHKDLDENINYTENFDTSAYVLCKFIKADYNFYLQDPFSNNWIFVLANKWYPLYRPENYINSPPTSFNIYIPPENSEFDNAQIQVMTVAKNDESLRYTTIGDRYYWSLYGDDNEALEKALLEGNTEKLAAFTDFNNIVSQFKFSEDNLKYSTNFDRSNTGTAKSVAASLLRQDVVGRIGDLCVEDSNDPRYLNGFWPYSISSWLLKGISHSPIYYWTGGNGAAKYLSNSYNLFDESSPGMYFNNRWNTLTKYHNASSREGSLPLGTKKPIKLGYDVNFSITTLGNFNSSNIEVYPVYTYINGQESIEDIALYSKVSQDGTSSNYKMIYKFDPKLPDSIFGNTDTIPKDKAKSIDNGYIYHCMYDGIDTQIVEANNQTDEVVTSEGVLYNNNQTRIKLGIFERAFSQFNSQDFITLSQKYKLGTPNYLKIPTEMMTQINSKYTYGDTNSGLDTFIHESEIPQSDLTIECKEHMTYAQRWQGKIMLPSSTVVFDSNDNKLETKNAKLKVSLYTTTKSDAGWTLVDWSKTINTSDSKIPKPIDTVYIDIENTAASDTKLYLIH